MESVLQLYFQLDHGLESDTDLPIFEQHVRLHYATANKLLNKRNLVYFITPYYDLSNWPYSTY